MIISVPKGRILKSFSSHLIKKNIFIKKNNRKLILKTNLSNFKVATIKSTDCFFFVNNGFSDIGLLGSDIFFDSGIHLNKNISFLKTDFFECRMSIIRNNKKNYKRNFFSVSTKYVNIVNNLIPFKNKKIIKISGSNELCIKLNVSDYIVDIIDTGKTLKKNKLFKVYDFFKVFPIFFFRKDNKFDLKKILKKII